MNERFREGLTGPRAKIVATGIAVASIGAACTPEQIATVQRAFPCEPPGPVTASVGGGEAGTGTEPVSGERGDSQTAVAQNRLLTIELPAFLTNREEIVICIPTAPTGEQAIANPPDELKYDISLDGLGLLASIQEKNKTKEDFENTNFRKLSSEVNALWRDHGETLSESPGIDKRDVNKKYFTEWLPMIKRGIHKNDPPIVYNLYQKKDIIYNKIRFSAAFAIDALYVYQNTSDPAVRQALAEVIDSARNFAVSSADPKAGNWKKSMKTFDQEAGWLSTYYQEGLSDPQ